MNAKVSSGTIGLSSTSPCSSVPVRSAPNANAASRHDQPINAAGPAHESGSAPKSEAMSRMPPTDSPSRASIRGITPREVSPTIVQCRTSMPPRTSRVTGRTAPSPDAGESSTVAPTAPAVDALRIIRSLDVSSASGSRPTPARSNAASSAARSVPVTGTPSCRAASTRASSGPSAARKSSPRERGLAPSVWSSRMAAASRPTSAGTTSSWIAQANRCASAGIIAGSWVVGVNRLKAPVSSATASARRAITRASVSRPVPPSRCSTRSSTVASASTRGSGSVSR